MATLELRLGEKYHPLSFMDKVIKIKLQGNEGLIGLSSGFLIAGGDFTVKSYRFRNRTEFEIRSEGKDLNRLINVLRQEKIHFYGMRLKADVLSGYIRSADYAVLASLCEKAGVKLEIRSHRGMVFALGRYKKRWGIPLGAVVAVMLVSFLSDRVMIIEIDGCETVSEERVMSLLEDCGISYGSSISAVDLYRTEERLVSMESSFAWVGIHSNGSRVIVDIQEITKSPETERKNTPCNIVAAKDAQIKGVKVYNGMLSVMVGDGVKKGDVIVSGTIETKYGRTYYVHSIAEITGIYTEKMTFSQPFLTEESVYSHTVTRKALLLFGKSFIIGRESVPQEDYEYRESIKRIRIGKVELPIGIAEMNYDILEKKEVTVTEEQAMALLEERILRHEKNFLSDDGAVIIGKDVKTDVTETGITVTIVYTMEGEIGTERQILAKYEPLAVPAEEDDEEKK